MTQRRIALLSLVAAFAVLGVLPALGAAGGELEEATGQAAQQPEEAVREVTQAVDQAVQQTTGKVQQGTQQAQQDVQGVTNSVPAPGGQTRQQSPSGDPQLQPPLHGTNPHGQGTVSAVDVDPDPARPQGGDPAGSDSGEEAVVGRSRGEQQADGSYHGHITILALFGQEVVGVDTQPGETQAGPLDAIQQGVLDPLCDGSADQICLEVLTADSATTENGSMNRFAVARAQLGGPGAITVGAGESQGNISDDGTCQTSTGSSSVADANLGGTTADAAQSESSTQACNDGRGTTTQSDSRVLNVGQAGVPLPAPGCGTGEETLIELVVLNVVCNATDTGTNFSVREALDVFVLPAAGSSLTKLSTAQAESLAVAPPAAVPAPAPVPEPAPLDEGDDAGDDAGADDDGEAPVGEIRGDVIPAAGDGGGANPECSDGIDNDGDGLVDFPDDPQCDSAQDDSESGGARAAGLPFSGANVLGLALAGLLALAGGLLLRRRGELPGTP